MWWNNYRLEYPFVLILIPVIIFLWYKYANKETTTFKTPTLYNKQLPLTWKSKLMPLLSYLRLACMLLIIIALARPQSKLGRSTSLTNGIDIVLALDISRSMLATDLQPDRITAAKNVAKDFISQRINDRLGLVIFSGESFTQCPVTSDHRILDIQLKNTQSGLLEDGTAIGMGLATSVSRLKNSNAENRIIILMTDGVNNAGFIDPITATELAKTQGVKVYCIGIGSNDYAKIPVTDNITGRTFYQMINVEIDEQLLTKIAKETGGKYYRATDNQSLQEIYKDINKLETSKLQGNIYENYKDHYYIFIILAFLLLFIEQILKIKILKLL
jgi:Ca-activated chloride channel family protein